MLFTCENYIVIQPRYNNSDGINIKSKSKPFWIVTDSVARTIKCKNEKHTSINFFMVSDFPFETSILEVNSKRDIDDE